MKKLIIDLDLDVLISPIKVCLWAEQNQLLTIYQMVHFTYSTGMALAKSVCFFYAIKHWTYFRHTAVICFTKIITEVQVLIWNEEQYCSDSSAL